jgi:tetratricopeptide (TPR) repeat protein
MPAEPARASTGEVFVGRSPELAALDLALTEASCGMPRLVVVGGEPGIGKSRLLDEFAHGLAGRGISLHWGRCREAGGAPPYWPWIQVLRTVSRQLDDRQLADSVGSTAGDLAQVMPEIGERLGSVPPVPELDPDSARFRQFDALTGFLSAAAASEPVVILLDDIHAADEPSLLFLAFLAAELRDSKVLLVVTTRTTEVARSERLASLLHDLGRVPLVRRLPLGRLPLAEVDRYLTLVLGEAPSRTLVASVAEQSDGNPLFLGEIVRLVQAEAGLGPSIGRGRMALPSDVRDTILRRATHVSVACNEVLRIAAVLGRELDVELLRVVADRPDEEVTDALDEAEAAMLVVSVPDAPGRVRFTHSLVRDALYDDVPPRRRTELHRQVGEALEQRHADDPEPVLAELALHFFEAAPIGEARRAVEYARRAGERAARQLAYEEAARLFRLALQALELSREHEPAVRCELLLLLGDALMRSGDLAEAQATYLPGAELARRHRLPELLARIALGYGGWFLWSALRGDPNFVPLIQDALEMLGPEDSVLRVQLLARYAGGALRDDLDRERKEALCDEAVAMARRLGDPAALGYAVDGRLGGLLWPDNVVERLDLGAEMIEMGRAIGAHDRVQAGHLYRCLAAIELADRQTADAELAVLWRMADELRSPATRWSVRTMAGKLLLMEGRLDEAEYNISEALALSKAQTPDVGVAYWMQLFMLRKEQGRLDEVFDAIQEHAARYPTRPLYRYALAHLHAVAGREREASWSFEALALHDFEDLPRNDEWLFGMVMLAEVVELVGDQERARRIYNLLAPHDQQVAVAAIVVGAGAVARALGILASMLGDLDLAEGHFATAVAVNQRLGAHLWVARSQYDWARLLLAADRLGDRERARGLLEQASATAVAVGSVDLQTRIAALGQPSRHGGLPSSATRRIRRDGETWAVDFDGATFRVRDTKGLRYLAVLLTRPHESVHVLELVGGDGTGADGASGAPVLDERAKASYQARLADLDAEVAEAEEWDDDERVARARAEIQALSEEVAAALGQLGHDRRFVSPSERARQSVTKAVRASIDRVGRQCPALGRHLTETVSTGTFLTYRPDRDAPPWRS